MTKMQNGHGEKKGIWEANQEILIFGRKLWNLKGNCALLYTKAHKNIWEIWVASQEETIFFSSESRR